MAKYNKKGVRGENRKRVNWIYNKYKRMYEYWRSDLERAVRNARAWWGINYGQWPQYVVEYLLDEEGRRPSQYNILLDKAETFVGSVLDNGFDVRFSQTNDTAAGETFEAQDVYFDDKHRMGWDVQRIAALLDCFIMVGYERMVISDREDPLGNISWETVNPRHVLLDPGWKSADVMDLKEYITWSDMYVDQIARQFPWMESKLTDLQLAEEGEGIDYGEFEGVAPYHDTEEKWQGKHRVIERHYVEETEEWWEYNLRDKTPFPETGWPKDSDGDRSAKTFYIRENNLQDDEITFIRKRRRIKYFDIIIPSLDCSTMVCDKERDIIQTQNVNLYPVGMRYNGQCQGLVDRLYDLQMDINRGEMDINDIQSRSAHGSFLLDSSLVGGDPELKDMIVKNWNNPSFRAFVAEGTLTALGNPQSAILEFPTTQPTPDMFNQQERRYNMVDKFSKVPAVQEARSESGTSGKLFNSKQAAALVGQKLYMTIIQQHEKAKTEGWLRQARITYAGVPRVFRKNDKPMFINVRARDAFGRRIILNDISKLPDMSITVIPSQNGTNVREEIRSRWGELLTLYGQNQSLTLYTAIGVGEVMETIDMTDERKEEVRQAGNLLKRREALAVAVQIKTYEHQLLQLQMADAQMMQGQGQGQPSMQEQGQGPEEEQPLKEVSYDVPDEEKLKEGTPQQNV